MISDDGAQSPVSCPRCGKGILIVKENSETGKEFLGCSNFPYCKNTYDDIEILNNPVKCPNCGGWMVKRISKHGEFYGCTNYKDDCKGTISIQQ